MKKTLQVIAIALVAMAMTTACNNKPAEEVEDTVAMEVVEDVVVEEATPVTEEVAEAPVAKEEVEEENAIKVDDVKAHMGDRKGEMTVSSSKAEVNFNSNDPKSHMGSRAGAMTAKE